MTKDVFLVMNDVILLMSVVVFLFRVSVFEFWVIEPANSKPAMIKLEAISISVFSNSIWVALLLLVVDVKQPGIVGMANTVNVMNI